jgi:hypothetical protein
VAAVKLRANFRCGGDISAPGREIRATLCSRHLKLSLVRSVIIIAFRIRLTCACPAQLSDLPRASI